MPAIFDLGICANPKCGSRDLYISGKQVLCYTCAGLQEGHPAAVAMEARARVIPVAPVIPPQDHASSWIDRILMLEKLVASQGERITALEVGQASHATPRKKGA